MWQTHVSNTILIFLIYFLEFAVCRCHVVSCPCSACVCEAQFNTKVLKMVLMLVDHCRYKFKGTSWKHVSQNQIHDQPYDIYMIDGLVQNLLKFSDIANYFLFLEKGMQVIITLIMGKELPPQQGKKPDKGRMKHLLRAHESQCSSLHEWLAASVCHK